MYVPSHIKKTSDARQRALSQCKVGNGLVWAQKKEYSIGLHSHPT